VRKLLAFASLALGVWFVGRLLAPVAPREVELRVRLGAFRDPPAQARGIEVALERGGAPVRVLRERFSGRPPAEWRRTLAVPPGDYEAYVSVELEGRVAERRTPVRVEPGELAWIPAPSD
jgi:hypothetical protein